jgi:hypothetical protein
MTAERRTDRQTHNRQEQGNERRHEPLCEKLLLLLLNRDGKLVSGNTTGYLLGGALLADLVLRGRVDIAGKGDPVKPGRVLENFAAAMTTAMSLQENRFGLDALTEMEPDRR